MWPKYIAREWPVVAAAIVFSGSAAATSAGWVETISGKSLSQGWVYLAAFILFAAVALFRLVRLQVQLDEGKGRIRLVARPGSYAINYIVSPEPPLRRDEASIHADIHFEIWADTDVDTAKLVLNIVGVRRRGRWKVWQITQPRTKQMIGIRIDGQDSATYRVFAR